MSRKKKTDLEKIREQLDREILSLINATVYRLVQKANVSEDNPLEKKLSIYLGISKSTVSNYKPL
jgi:hypothetical protein